MAPKSSKVAEVKKAKVRLQVVVCSCHAVVRAHRPPLTPSHRALMIAGGGQDLRSQGALHYTPAAVRALDLKYPTHTRVCCLFAEQEQE